MERIRNDHLIMELEEAQIKTKKIGRITGDIHPTVGDLVLIRNDGKQDYDRYGIVEQIISPQTLKIRTRNGTIERPTSITVPISANCLIVSTNLKNKTNIA